MKMFNLVAAILFVLFAGLQYNDPDPYIWIPIYVVSAYVCFQTYKGKFDRFSHWIIVAFCLIYAVRLMIDPNGVIAWFKEHDAENLVQSMKATKPWIEQTREFGGLLIILLVTSVNIIANKKAAAK
ncbi:MAG: transmembrane 220 family protein [Bacteroidota bacterium]|jgi:hypothetical protein